LEKKQNSEFQFELSFRSSILGGQFESCIGVPQVEKQVSIKESVTLTTAPLTAKPQKSEGAKSQIKHLDSLVEAFCLNNAFGCIYALLLTILLINPKL